MDKNKILITSKIIRPLTLNFSVNEGLIYEMQAKTGVLYAFRKPKILHSLDKVKLCLHWSQGHLTVSFPNLWQTINQYVLELRNTCRGLQYMARPGAHCEQCGHHRGVNYTGCQPLFPPVAVPSDLNTAAVSLFVMLSMSEWPCWHGGQEKDKLWFKEVPSPCWVVSF